MRRRDFITLLGSGAASWPLAARSQQQRIWRVGYLISGPPDALDSFRRRMTELGYVEGNNLIVEARAAAGHYDRLPAFAKEIADLHPDAIVAEATPAIAAAQRATMTIPIVMAPATDPIGSGFIESFARPGGNITGVANMFGDLTAKSLEILHRVLPDAKMIAVLMSANPTHAQLYEVARNGAQKSGCARRLLWPPHRAIWTGYFWKSNKQNAMRFTCWQTRTARKSPSWPRSTRSLRSTNTAFSSRLQED